MTSAAVRKAGSTYIFAAEVTNGPSNSSNLSDVTSAARKSYIYIYIYIFFSLAYTAYTLEFVGDRNVVVFFRYGMRRQYSTFSSCYHLWVKIIRAGGTINYRLITINEIKFFCYLK